MQITILLENDHGGPNHNNVKMIPMGEFDPPAGLIAMSLERIANLLHDAVKNHRMAAIISHPGVEVITDEKFIQMAKDVRLSDVQPFLRQDLAPGPASN